MSAEPDDALAIVVRVARALERAGVKYVVGGSIASSVYGEPRATRDIDVAVQLTEPQVAAVIEQLGQDFAVDEEVLGEAVRAGRSANIFYLPQFMKVDLFIRKFGEYDVVEFGRAVRVEALKGEPVSMSSAEDNLLWKLRWFRDAGESSEQQWRDILGVLRTSGPRLEATYLKGWAERFGVLDLLERAREQAER